MTDPSAIEYSASRGIDVMIEAIPDPSITGFLVMMNPPDDTLAVRIKTCSSGRKPYSTRASGGMRMHPP
jgi:hypothetical protein